MSIDTKLAVNPNLFTEHPELAEFIGSAAGGNDEVTTGDLFEYVKSSPEARQSAPLIRKVIDIQTAANKANKAEQAAAAKAEEAAASEAAGPTPAEIRAAGWREKFGEMLVDQPDAIEAGIMFLESSFRNMQKGAQSGILIGPSGVGKTEFSKALAYVVNDDPEALVFVDCNQYKDEHMVQGLIGSSGDYAGSPLESPLHKQNVTNKIGGKDLIIIFDEYDKMEPKAQKKLLEALALFLSDRKFSLLGEEEMQDYTDRRVFMLVTSNQGFDKVGNREGEDLVNYYRDEARANMGIHLLRRFKRIIPFRELKPEGLEKIARITFKGIEKKLNNGVLRELTGADIRVKLELGGTLLDTLGRLGYNQTSGAGNLGKLRDDVVVPRLMDWLERTTIEMSGSSTENGLDEAVILLDIENNPAFKEWLPKALSEMKKYKDEIPPTLDMPLKITLLNPPPEMHAYENLSIPKGYGLGFKVHGSGKLENEMWMVTDDGLDGIHFSLLKAGRTDADDKIRTVDLPEDLASAVDMNVVSIRGPNGTPDNFKRIFFYGLVPNDEGSLEAKSYIYSEDDGFQPVALTTTGGEPFPPLSEAAFQSADGKLAIAGGRLAHDGDVIDSLAPEAIENSFYVVDISNPKAETLVATDIVPDADPFNRSSNVEIGRAGAALILGPDNALYQIGGEALDTDVVAGTSDAIASDSVFRIDLNSEKITQENSLEEGLVSPLAWVDGFGQMSVAGGYTYGKDGRYNRQESSLLFRLNQTPDGLRSKRKADLDEPIADGVSAPHPRDGQLIGPSGASESNWGVYRHPEVD